MEKMDKMRPNSCAEGEVDEAGNQGNQNSSEKNNEGKYLKMVLRL